MTLEASARSVIAPPAAAPFWISLLLPPLALVGALAGGWTVALLPVCTWLLFSGLDFAIGRRSANPGTETPDSALAAHRAITLLWAPVQAALLFWLLWYVPGAEHLGLAERVVLFVGVGVITGTVGITYSHELMHQRSKAERWFADLLLAMVLYSHFRSEHLLVHHRHVATPGDAVTARFGEGFYGFFLRVLRHTPVSAFRAEAAMLARKGRPWHDRANPFWRYGVLQAAMLALAFALGGWAGLGLFVLQAGVAIWQLELVNYIEHYGLTRAHLGEGRYEAVQPRHSWNADQRASNWLLINLQRHSDHHYKPARRYPLLQTYETEEAPQLPQGYPVMTMAAMVPPLWRRIMNPRVRAWRALHYPEITDWSAYDAATNPAPGHGARAVEG